jgi:hypothetical protein
MNFNSQIGPGSDVPADGSLGASDTPARNDTLLKWQTLAAHAARQGPQYLISSAIVDRKTRRHCRCDARDTSTSPRATSAAIMQRPSRRHSRVWQITTSSIGSRTAYCKTPVQIRLIRNPSRLACVDLQTHIR